MRYGILTNGVPVPKGDKVLLKELAVTNGVGQYPKVILRDAAFKAANGIVEIKNQSYDSKFQYLADAVDGYTDLGNGVWQENKTVLTKNKQQVFALRLAEVERKHDEVSEGGMIYNAKNYSTTKESQNRIGNLVASIANGRGARQKKIVTREGEFITLNALGFKAWANAFGDHAEDAYDNMIAHSEALATLLTTGTAQEIIDYDITTGWPVNPPAEEII